MNFPYWNDSTSALMVFKNRSLVLVLLCNRWHNLGKETVALIYMLIWVIRYKAQLGSRCCLRLFRVISFWTGVGSLALGSRSPVFPSFFLLLFVVSFFFSFFVVSSLFFLKVLA